MPARLKYVSTIMETVFPKSDRQNISTFFTTKPTGQGLGLGLSMSYDIIKAHGGNLSVETKEANLQNSLSNYLRANSSLYCHFLCKVFFSFMYKLCYRIS